MPFDHPIRKAHFIRLLHQDPDIFRGAGDLYSRFHAVIEHDQVVALLHIVKGKTDSVPDTLLTWCLAQ